MVAKPDVTPTLEGELLRHPLRSLVSTRTQTAETQYLRVATEQPPYAQQAEVLSRINSLLDENPAIEVALDAHLAKQYATGTKHFRIALVLSASLSFLAGLMLMLFLVVLLHR